MVGNWTHLAVVYDATLRQLHLYVNGILSGIEKGPFLSLWAERAADLAQVFEAVLPSRDTPTS